MRLLLVLATLVTLFSAAVSAAPSKAPCIVCVVKEGEKHEEAVVGTRTYNGVEYYFRMGSNETNYYEVAVPFTSAFYNETGWARVVFKMSDLTNLKFAIPDTVVTSFARDLADPSREYPISMRGQPNLNGVRFLYAGVRNVSNAQNQSGEIWMDDIFVGDVMRDFDHAERISANFSIAGGAISFGGNWARTGADYRGLRQTRGAGADLTVLGLNAKDNWAFSVLRTQRPFDRDRLISQLRLAPESPVNNLTSYRVQRSLDSLSNLLVRAGQLRPDLRVHLLDSRTLVFADPAPMKAFLVRRLVRALIVLWGVTLMSFGVLFLKGDPSDAMAGAD